MAANIAARRAAKAQRRKAVVAEKRKVDAILGSRAGQISLAAKTPIRDCLLQTDLFSVGLGTLLLVRGASASYVAVGSFLIDSFALGVKDVMFRMMERSELDAMLAQIEAVSRHYPFDPASARKLLHDVTAWAAAAGFRPHPEYVAVEKLFGDVDANASQATFEFGHQGKALYMPGPSESASDVRDRLQIAAAGSSHYPVPV
jgi:hypothetical protein